MSESPVPMHRWSFWAPMPSELTAWRRGVDYALATGMFGCFVVYNFFSTDQRWIRTVPIIIIARFWLRYKERPHALKREWLIDHGYDR